jgi:poly(3-hydroxybutyrate) depolymerase
MPYYLLMRSSTRDRLAAVAANAGDMYCSAGDTECADQASGPLHAAPTPILHLHGTNDGDVPPPTATFHDPVDWSVDFRVFAPMKFWAQQNGCFAGDNSSKQDSGVLLETYTVGSRSAERFDLSAWGAACSRYQLVLVENGGHVIAGQHERIWRFLRAYTLAP